MLEICLTTCSHFGQIQCELVTVDARTGRLTRLSSMDETRTSLSSTTIIDEPTIIEYETRPSADVHIPPMPTREPPKPFMDSLPSFITAISSRKKLPRYLCFADEEVSFYGTLRSHLRNYNTYMRLLLPHLERIFCRFVYLQYTEYDDVGWKDHWKEVSYWGYDVYKGMLIDYGNVEYYVLIHAMCDMSPYCKECMLWLGTNYFASLHPNAVASDHSIEMHGDVFEIIMAALRGHPEFQDVTPRPLPPMFEKLTQVCRTIHLLDACIRTSRVKFQQARAPRIGRLMPDMAQHPFVQHWCDQFACPSSPSICTELARAISTG